MLKHKYFLLIALICTMFIASCNGTDIPSPKDNTIVTTTPPAATAVTTSTTQDTSAVTFGTQSAEWKRELTESEKQSLLDEMPEIVFVMSEHYGEENIYGYYLMKTGEIRLFDFRNIAPDEIYEIPDVLERLEEATCDCFERSDGNYSIDEKGNIIPHLIYKQNFTNVSEDKLVDYYNRLKHTDGAERIIIEPLYFDGKSEWICYGIETNNEENEIIALGGNGIEFTYLCQDNDKVLPDLLYDVCHLFIIE